MSLVVVYFAANTLVNLYLIKKERVELKDRTTLILGDSHPQRSIDPKLMANAVNVCQSAEPPVVSYWKLKALHRQNQIDTVILGLAPHNLSSFNDLKFSDATWAEEMFRRTYAIADFGALKDQVQIDQSVRLKVLWKQLSFYPKRKHAHYIGGFVPVKTSNVTNWKDPIDRHYFKEGETLPVSAVQQNYLDSIILFCHRMEYTLILTSHPLYCTYWEHIPANHIDHYWNLTENLNGSALVFDRSHHTYPDSLFSNTDHLNKLGAKRFTTELTDWMAQQGSEVSN